uniref:Uncharacterized protein n=1 Tax=Zea mays TaxID=4577 RepID=C4IZG9_MAIZE|nr:unknown [Zea mays]
MLFFCRKLIPRTAAALHKNTAAVLSSVQTTRAAQLFSSRYMILNHPTRATIFGSQKWASGRRNGASGCHGSSMIHRLQRMQQNSINGLVLIPQLPVHECLNYATAPREQ